MLYLTGPDWDGFRKMIFDEEDHHLLFAAYFFLRPPQRAPTISDLINGKLWDTDSVTSSEPCVCMSAWTRGWGKRREMKTCWMKNTTVLFMILERNTLTKWSLHHRKLRIKTTDTHNIFSQKKTKQKQKLPTSSHLMMQWPHSRDLAFVFNIKREREQ